MYCLLSGSPPFHGKTDDQIFRKVLRGKFTMRGTRWSPVSEEAKELICQCLEKDVSARVTAANALTHAWFRRSAESAGESLKYPALSRKFFQSSVLAYPAPSPSLPPFLLSFLPSLPLQASRLAGVLSTRTCWPTSRHDMIRVLQGLGRGIYLSQPRHSFMLRSDSHSLSLSLSISICMYVHIHGYTYTYTHTLYTYTYMCTHACT